MKSVNLAALVFAATFSGAVTVGASELSPSTPEAAVSHAQAWNLTKLRTHVVKHRHKRRADRRRYQAKLRALMRKRYWGSWSRNYDRFEGFAFHGDGFRTSGKYQ